MRLFLYVSFPDADYEREIPPTRPTPTVQAPILIYFKTANQYIVSN